MRTNKTQQRKEVNSFLFSLHKRPILELIQKRPILELIHIQPILEYYYSDNSWKTKYIIQAICIKMKLRNTTKVLAEDNRSTFQLITKIILRNILFLETSFRGRSFCLMFPANFTTVGATESRNSLKFAQKNLIGIIFASLSPTITNTWVKHLAFSTRPIRFSQRRPPFASYEGLKNLITKY